MTSRVCYLDEGDYAILTRDGGDISTPRAAPSPARSSRSRSSNVYAEKGPYKHFMAKEMHEQPSVIAGPSTAIYADRTAVDLPSDMDFSDCARLVLVACGTAYYACHVAKYWFEQLARIPVEIDVASEFRYREPPLDAGTVGVFVSQSGETVDTLAALR